MKYVGEQDYKRLNAMFDKGYPKLLAGVITAKAVKDIDKLLESTWGVFYGRGWLALEIGLDCVTRY